jgi:beta-glucosidase
MTHFSGEQGGLALADVLSGTIEPSGRLTISVPRSAGACPYHYNHKFKSAGTPIARHFGSDYPFGYGLSYTTFEYSDLIVAAAEVPNDGGEVVVSVNITNTGARSGFEVAQLYIRDQVASLVRPVMELKSFARLSLAPGESSKVTFRLPTDMLNFTAHSGNRIVEPGEFELMLGASSSDIRLTSNVVVTGNVRELPQDWRMESSVEIVKL